MTHDSHRPVYKLLLACSHGSHQAESRGSNQAVLTVKRVQQQQQPGNDICRGGGRWPVLTRPLQCGGRIIDQKV